MAGEFRGNSPQMVALAMRISLGSTLAAYGGSLGENAEAGLDALYSDLARNIKNIGPGPSVSDDAVQLIVEDCLAYLDKAFEDSRRKLGIIK